MGLTHFDKDGKAIMVDVTEKEEMILIPWVG
jgi:molybdenum cofactor biosynthesis enzyme